MSFASKRTLLCVLCLLPPGLLAGCQQMTNKGRVIVIAGASSGFGKGVALKLADQQASLVLASRRTQLLDELAGECQRRGAQAIAVTTDVSDPKQVEKLRDQAVSRFGHIDVWINMAGIGAIGRFDEIPLEDHLRLIDINVKGMISGSYYALGQFRQQGYGTLINMASSAGEVPFPYFTSYVASKHAIVGLDVAMRQELQVNGDRDIHVCTVMPYASDTPWWGHAANYSGSKTYLPAMDSPEVVVDAIVRATLHPQDRITPGKAGALLAAHRMAPELANKIAANVTQSAKMHSPPASQSSGSLFTPMQTGIEVEGHVREEMKEYKKTHP